MSRNNRLIEQLYIHLKMAIIGLLNARSERIWKLFLFLLISALVVFISISYVAVDREVWKRYQILEQGNMANSTYKKNVGAVKSGEDLTYKSEENNHQTGAHSSYKRILFWNSFADKDDFGIGIGSEVLKEMNCSINQCTFTTDKSELEAADAVFIHGFGLHRDDLPERKNREQIFVFFMYESPSLAGRSNGKLSTLDDVFNLTFTYLDHPDTDIFAPLGRAVKRITPKPVAIPTSTALESKSKLVLWIVSNCWPHSIRMEYGMELQKYVPVDVYGECGNYSCPPGLQNIQCMANLSNSYMFYLAFENSHCQDYYTEKVLNPLHLKLVPITLGGTNYTKYLPPNSFIDIREFSSVEDLAKMLLFLKNDVIQYRRYFWWRQFFEIKNIRPGGFCKLCEILHNPNYTYKSHFHIDKYWDPDKLCLNRSQQLKVYKLR